MNVPLFSTATLCCALTGATMCKVPRHKKQAPGGACRPELGAAKQVAKPAEQIAHPTSHVASEVELTAVALLVAVPMTIAVALVIVAIAAPVVVEEGDALALVFKFLAAIRIGEVLPAAVHTLLFGISVVTVVIVPLVVVAMVG